MPLTAAQKEDELRFWLPQDAEHNLFFYLGFQEPGLKAAAKQLYDEYQQAFSLRRGDNLHLALRNILPRSQALKMRARAMQDRGVWTGWIYPSFLDHTRGEMDVMLARIRPSGITSREELCFGNRMNADHLAFAAHLLDPSEAAAEALLNGKLRPNAEAVSNACFRDTYGTLREISQRVGGEVDRFFSGLDLSKVKDVIHPALAAHVVREGQRFLQTIERLPTQAA